MADAFAPVQPGAPLRIPAEAYNAMLAAAKAHRGRAMAVEGQWRQLPPGGVLAPVRNEGASVCPRFGALGVAGATVTDDAGWLLRGGPLEAAHVGRWVIALEPIAPGAIGTAMVAGCTLATVKVRAAAQRCADVLVVDGVPQLATRHHGYARVLWVAGESGQQLALLLFPADAPPGIRSGRLTTELDCNNPSATATMQVLVGNTVIDTITVYPPPARDLGVILAGMRVEAAYDPDHDRHVVVAGGKAKLLTVIAQEAFVATDGEVEVNVDDWDDGDDPDPEDAGLQVLNELGFEGAASSKWFAQYLPQLDRYRLYQGACPEV